MDESSYRLIIFLFVLVACMAAEHFFPRRQRYFARIVRWKSNFGITILNTVLVRLVFPAGAVGMALFFSEKSWGLFSGLGDSFFHVLLTLLILDVAIYWQHRLMHKIPVLWKLHRMHHTDVDLDASSALRFHPVEILLSLVFKGLLIAVFGLSAEGVLIFEVALNGFAIFNHANIRISERWDSLLRLFVVTPDFHRIHHSVTQVETDSNFGFSVPWWDYLFRSYTLSPKHGQEGMEIGQEIYRSDSDQKILSLLKQPFI